MARNFKLTQSTKSTIYENNLILNVYHHYYLNNCAILYNKTNITKDNVARLVYYL